MYLQSKDWVAAQTSLNEAQETQCNVQGRKNYKPKKIPLSWGAMWYQVSVASVQRFFLPSGVHATTYRSQKEEGALLSFVGPAERKYDGN